MDPVEIRIRPDPECLDPAGSRMSGSGLDPDPAGSENCESGAPLVYGL